MQEFDLIVVGSGPAGRRGAIQAAKLGRKVLVIEQGKRVGGVSVHTGTIPSKTLRETALISSPARAGRVTVRRASRSARKRVMAANLAVEATKASRWT